MQEFNTDSEYDTDNEYDTDSDSDNDNDNDIIYEPEELSTTQYNIILCEIYNEELHGQSNEAKYSYLVHLRLKNLDIKLINNFITNGAINNSVIKLEIAQCIYLESQHCVAILKTFWIKIIQRTWKNILKKRKEVIIKRRQFNSLNYKQLTGKWPQNCLTYPGLRGMLSLINF
jgi:hypothetical protein